MDIWSLWEKHYQSRQSFPSHCLLLSERSFIPFRSRDWISPIFVPSKERSKEEDDPGIILVVFVHLQLRCKRDDVVGWVHGVHRQLPRHSCSVLAETPFFQQHLYTYCWITPTPAITTPSTSSSTMATVRFHLSLGSSLVLLCVKFASFWLASWWVRAETRWVWLNLSGWVHW